MCDFCVRENKQTKEKIYKGKFSRKINYFPVRESLSVISRAAISDELHENLNVTKGNLKFSRQVSLICLRTCQRNFAEFLLSKLRCSTCTFLKVTQSADVSPPLVFSSCDLIPAIFSLFTQTFLLLYLWEFIEKLFFFYKRFKKENRVFVFFFCSNLIFHFLFSFSQKLWQRPVQKCNS